jgi:hypothetical protein
MAAGLVLRRSNTALVWTMLPIDSVFMSHILKLSAGIGMIGANPT